MPKAVRRVNARVAVQISRRVLVTKSEASKQAAHYDAVRHAVQVGFNALRESIAEIRTMGLGIADLRPQIESRTVEHSSPRAAITAFSASGSSVAEARLTIHVEPIENDIDDSALFEFQISHIVGVHAKERGNPNWICSHADGLIATVDIDVQDIGRLVHDVLLDIAMARANCAPWAGIRDTLTARQLAARKIEFLQQQGIQSDFTYGNLEGKNYAPLSSVFPRPLGSQTFSREQLGRYIDTWEKFGIFCKNSYLRGPTLNRDDSLDLARQIVRSHRHGGQISVDRLANTVAQLAPGAYRLYFLIHRGATPAARARIGALFHKSPNHLHTQLWIVHAEGSRDADAKYLIDRSWVLYYPFIVGGSK